MLTGTGNRPRTAFTASTGTIQQDAGAAESLTPILHSNSSLGSAILRPIGNESRQGQTIQVYVIPVATAYGSRELTD